MKVTPAHAIEARKMADDLLQECLYNEFPLNISLESPEDEPTILDIRNYMSASFGWDSWDDMNEAIQKPHVPVYLDNNDELLNEVVLRLSKCFGYKHASGHMYKFIVNSGAGFSPAKRRQLEALASPWGTIQETHSIAPGIEEIKTESHGGYVLGEQAQSDMPKHLTLNSKYYEEDCEGALVELAFPEFFPDSIKYALASIGIYSSISVPHYVPQEHLDWLDSVSSPLFKKKGHESKTPNRDMTDAEKHVVKYLAKCVLNNRNPIKMPDSTYPSLQDWVTCLESAMTVDGEWPLGKGKWKEHFYSEDIY